MVLELNHPTLGKVKQIGFPIKLSDTLAKIRRLGVVTNLDTEEILSSSVYTKDEIEELRKHGALG
jgi:alpha-methylacyl-CoA racemase